MREVRLLQHKKQGLQAGGHKGPCRIIMKKICVPVKELFSSIQGEAVYAGCRQVFIRFAGCNLYCSYCDEKKKPAAGYYSEAELLKAVLKLDKLRGPHHSVSLTGGEPLVHADFLRTFLPLLKERGFKVYLETNGTLAGNLKKIKEYVDIISMDLKLPSSTKGAPLWKEHAAFISAAGKKELFVKVVVTPFTKAADVVKSALSVKMRGRPIPYIIQPVYGFKGYMRLADIACRYLADVRVIPQIHKLLGVK